jgi:S1-C subfamily serine protease
MKHLISPILLTCLALLIGACSGTATPSNAVISTPIDALPIRVGGGAAPVLPTPVSQEIIAEADAEYALLANIYARVMPSVVNIEADIEPPGSLTKDTSRGSGFIYDTDGHIITSAHVVKNARDIRVTFNDGTIASAKLIGVDTYSDLGVIKVTTKPERLLPLTLGNSDAVRVGQRAIAIGNPFGLSGSMSVGIVSGLGRTLRSAALIDTDAIPGFQNPAIIQTDTPINPGNSGGPLLNSQGEVVGVNTAIRTENGVFQGVGFAVPTRTLARVVPELIEKGKVEYAWIGISVAPEDNGYGVAGLADALNLPVQQGVLVRGVTVNSPADVAGLFGGKRVIEVRGQPICTGGDIIVAINGDYIRNMDEFTAYLVVNVLPGDTVTLRLVREGQTFDLPVTLAKRPAESGEVRDCSG